LSLKEIGKKSKMNKINEAKGKGRLKTVKPRPSVEDKIKEIITKKTVK